MDSRRIAIRILSHIASGSITSVPHLQAIYTAHTRPAGQIEISNGADVSPPAQNSDWIAYTFGGITAAAAIASAIANIGRR